MTKKESFIVYGSWEGNLEGLSLKQKGMILESMFEFSKTGVKPQIGDPVVRTAFNGIAAQMEINAAKYTETCEKNARNAMKRWGQKTRKTEAGVCDGNEKDANECIMKNDNVNDIENDNGNVIDIDKSKEMPPAPSAEVGSADAGSRDDDGETAQPASEPSEVKLYGRRSNVRLTEAEYSGLVGEYPKAEVDKCIDWLSDYIALGNSQKAGDPVGEIHSYLKKSGVRTLAEMEGYYRAADTHKLALG